MKVRESGLGAPALAQVNLLPPEVRSARTVGRVKQWMLVVVGLSMLAVLAAYGVAILDSRNAQTQLAASRRTTEDLEAERATYAEVPPVLATLDDANRARQLGMSSEVLWADYLSAIETVVAPTMSIDTAAVSVIDTSETLQPLDEPAVATLTFVGRLTALPDLPAWIDGLDAIPGFANARVEVATVTGTDTVSYYEVTSSVRVTWEALSLRFSTPDETTEEG